MQFVRTMRRYRLIPWCIPWSTSTACGSSPAIAVERFHGALGASRQIDYDRLAANRSRGRAKESPCGFFFCPSARMCSENPGIMRSATASRRLGRHVSWPQPRSARSSESNPPPANPHAFFKKSSIAPDRPAEPPPTQSPSPAPCIAPATDCPERSSDLPLRHRIADCEDDTRMSNRWQRS